MWLVLLRFLPPWCPDHVKVNLDPAIELEKKVEKAIGKRLDLSSWQIAWICYVLAGVILKQFTFAQAMAHMMEVLEIAMTAHVDKMTPRSPLLGVLYDEVLRHVACVVRLWSFSLPVSCCAGRSGKISRR